jgi:hypothetical protein
MNKVIIRDMDRRSSIDNTTKEIIQLEMEIASREDTITEQKEMIIRLSKIIDSLVEASS